MKKHAIAFALLIVLGGCSRTELVRNIEHVPMRMTTPKYGLEDVENAIMRAGISLGWEMKKLQPGSMEGVFRRGQHVIRVNISYDLKSYSIAYKDSENMLYDSGEIHKAYNKWTKELSDEIALVGGGYPTQAFSPTPFVSTAAAQRQEHQGLAIEVEIVSEPPRLKTLFGSDDLGEGTLVMHVRAQNSNDTRSFIVKPEDFHLGYLESVSIGFRSRGSEAAAAVGSVLFSPMLLFPGLSGMKTASIIQHTLMVKRFKSATLSKGASREGFIYFQIPQKHAQTNRDLDVSVSEAGNGAPLRYRFTLTEKKP